MERREGKDGGEMDERKIVANDRRRLGAGFPYRESRGPSVDGVPHFHKLY